MTHNNTKWLGIGLFIISLIAHSGHAAIPEGLDLGALHQKIETSKKQYLDKKEKYEAKQKKAQELLKQLQKQSATQTSELLTMIQDESTKKETILQQIEDLKSQLKSLNTAKLTLLKEKRQILREKHEENHQLRQALLRMKRFYGEQFIKLYVKG